MDHYNKIESYYFLYMIFHKERDSNLHDRTGVRALLWLALPDEEGSVTFASQHFLSLGAFDVTHIPGALIMVGWALVLLQWVGAADTGIKQALVDVLHKTLFNLPQYPVIKVPEIFITYSSASFFMPSHSLIFFCLVPFCVSHLQHHIINAGRQFITCVADMWF